MFRGKSALEGGGGRLRVGEAGERRQVTFNAPTTYCQADLRVEFADGGNPAIWQNLNLCTLTKIKLAYDRGTGMTTASYDD